MNVENSVIRVTLGNIHVTDGSGVGSECSNYVNELIFETVDCSLSLFLSSYFKSSLDFVLNNAAINVSFIRHINVGRDPRVLDSIESIHNDLAYKSIVPN